MTTKDALNSSRTPVWLLSAYRAESHARWADWLVATFDEFGWQRLELPGRHFSWRIRGNPLSWLDSLPEQAPELIVATSMVDEGSADASLAELPHRGRPTSWGLTTYTFVP